MLEKMPTFDELDPTQAVVVGAGPAGLASALALAQAGLDVALVGPPAYRAAAERRTAALFPSSINALRNLGVWDAVAPASAPMTGLRIIDETSATLRSPQVLFEARELGLEVLAYNVPNAALVEALEAAVAAQPRISRAALSVAASIETGAAGVTVQPKDGAAVTARLAVAADGKTSLARAAAGIAAEAWAYEQTAIVASFAHSRPHRGVSTEMHRHSGPLTTVPLPGRASSLVWLVKPEQATQLLALDDAAFSATLEGELQGLLGSVAEITPRTSFPMQGLGTDRYGARRIALVGETAHAFPPVGAQGLNLTLRDIAALADIAGRAKARGEDPGSDAVLAAYDAARRGDVKGRTTGVDLLNRSLLAGLGPIDLARGAGLHLLAAIGPLRRLAMRRGMGPGGEQPALLRG